MPPVNSDHIIIVKRCISGYLEQRRTEAAEPGTELYRLGQKYGHLARHKSPTILDLSGIDLNDAELIQMLPEIAKLTQVTELHLSKNVITGLALSHLREAMPQLKELRVDQTKIKQNDGCGELAKFKNLNVILVDHNYLTNEEHEKLQLSTSLLRVGDSHNKNVDIVRKARLLAALDYNNKVRLQVSVGVKTMEITKDEYIRTHFEEFRKKTQQRDKLSDHFERTLNAPTGFKIPISYEFTKVK